MINERLGHLDMNQVFNAIYPVGAIYMSVNSTSPALLFGGTWEQIQDTFLLAGGWSYTPGNTGGSATHTPSGSVTSTETAHTHNYGFTYGGYYSDTVLESNVNAGVWQYDTSNNHTVSGPGTRTGTIAVARNSGTSSVTTSSETAHYEMIGNTSYVAPTITSTFTGEEQDTMPPYLAVYIWKRIS